MKSALFAAILALVAFAVACGGGSGGDPSPTPTPASPTEVTPSPADVPSPTPDLALLEQADRLYRDGYFEVATDLYESAVTVPGLRTEALWKLAVARFGRGLRSEAAAALRTLLNEDIDPERERRALLLYGAIYASRGDGERARDPLTQYIESGGPAAPYAKLRLAEIAAADDRFEEAITLTEEAIAEGIASGTETSALFSIAEYQEETGDINGAIASYSRLANTGNTAGDQAEALWDLANVASENGFPETARVTLVRLVTSYPLSGRALEALDHPSLSGISTFDRGVVLYNHRLNQEATAVFQSFLDGDPVPLDAAAAHYRLGILSERAGDYEQAVNHYDSAIALAPGSSAAISAMWDRALVLHVLDRLDEAVDAYILLADTAPASSNALEALFRAGLIRYQQALAGESLEIWERYLFAATSPHDIARAEFWLGKAWERLGDQAGVAVRHYQNAADAAPFDFYGLRSRAILDGAGELPSGPPATTAPDWPEAETWLESIAGPEDALTTDAFFDDRWERALELREAGLIIESDLELIDIRDRAIGSPWLLYRLARAARDEGIDWLTSRAGGILADSYAEPPPAILMLNYPLAYFDLVSQEAEANGISPYLLLGLIRQESLYDPAAISPADAVGLSQIIPPTAEQIAVELGVDDFTQPDLLRPHVNLRFGAYYLASTLEYVDGSIPAALAGYNGGPGNAARWQEQAGFDRDVFIEVIDFRETSAYVELVLENYALYHYAYGLVEAPYLPL